MQGCVCESVHVLCVCYVNEFSLASVKYYNVLYYRCSRRYEVSKAD